MLRRGARALRMLLFGVGLLLLLWWPVSTVYYVYVEAPSPFRATWISSSRGALSVILFRELPFSDPVGFRAGARRVHWIDPGFTPLPVVSGSNSWGYVTTHITIPLWLLAFLR